MMTKNKNLITLMANAILFIIFINHAYLSLISIIIFYSIVLTLFLLNIQTIGSETEIYTGLSFLLPPIITLKNNKFKWINHHFKIRPESLLTKELLKLYIKQI